MSASFRVSTILRSREKLFRQRFHLLGACTRINPPYTPFRILIGRAMARPLVRHARLLLVVRGVFIALIALGVPAFAIYSIVVLPSLAQIYTRSISITGRAITGIQMNEDLPDPQEASIFLFFNDMQSDGRSNFTLPLDVNVNITSRLSQSPCFLRDTFEVPQVTSMSSPEFVTYPLVRFGCFWDWSSQHTVSISAQLPVGSVMQVALARGINFVNGSSDPLVVSHPSQYPSYLAPSAFVFPESKLVGGFRWTRKDRIARLKWGVSSAINSIYTADISGLQPYAAANDTGTGVTTLLLYQQSPYVTRILQETIDDTALSGISTFGGFWTFLNGAFALFFGAHVLYFMFAGRRPLSALGIAHIFQKGALVRRWHEDFPAIRTEGGLPGSNNAGIVAFIRDRLVDLGEDPRVSDEEVGYDVEAQKLKTETDEEEVTLVQSPVE
ncbi:hypothetical protein R3P38DRAFT_3476306 [Favolaschia claudopus]|uniref:Uncharacterized protein n=1 Tax=Favolaschia claudopus TaxID=2862362 RepID=A0AAV9ZAP2_9AGAR